MGRFAPFILLIVALGLYGLVIPHVWDNRDEVRSAVPAGYVIPSKFSRILSLGNQGILSDFIFLKAATFVGGRSGEEQQMSEEDWRYLIGSLDVVTDLDPYFEDPYVLAEGLLAWEAGKPGAANTLLRKGMQYRDNDWRMPFYIGFNHYYFLNDFETAAGYIMQASQLPGSPSYLANLGARLAYYAGKSQTALLFLKDMLLQTNDPLLKTRLSLRLGALEGAVIIENAIEVFRLRFGRAPGKGELEKYGIIDKMPVEPYGGQWIVSKDGRVYSTSKFSRFYMEIDQ